MTAIAENKISAQGKNAALRNAAFTVVSRFVWLLLGATWTVLLITDAIDPSYWQCVAWALGFVVASAYVAWPLREAQ